jgi:MinD superfamily P-loop ATPase
MMVREPEVALVFTPEPWVEELHRHLTDHGGARVRQLVVEPNVALEEHYDALVVSHRWPALTRAFVDDIHERGRVVLGVYERDEPAGRTHLRALGADATVVSDEGPAAFVDALVALQARLGELVANEPQPRARARRGRIVLVGGPTGAGRTEIAVQLARELTAPLVDADDVAPGVAPRLSLPIEPNLRTAIDAVEHGRGELVTSVVHERVSGLAVLGGLPNPSAWAQIRPGEVVRVVERLAADAGTVVVDAPGNLEELAGPTRGRYAIARALLLEADVVVAVCHATPVGVSRFLAWVADARALAPDTPTLTAVNRAPTSRFRRGELYEEITRSAPMDVVFVPDDRRVGDAAWNGTPVARGPFVRAVAQVASATRAARRDLPDESSLDERQHEQPGWEVAS